MRIMIASTVALAGAACTPAAPQLSIIDRCFEEAGKNQPQSNNRGGWFIQGIVHEGNQGVSCTVMSKPDKDVNYRVNINDFYPEGNGRTASLSVGVETRLVGDFKVIDPLTNQPIPLQPVLEAQITRYAPRLTGSR